MKVVAYDPFGVAELFRELCGARDVRRGARAGGFLTLHLPLTDDTRNVINAASIARCATSVGSSTPRGRAARRGSARRGARIGEVAGAAIDVFSTESPYDVPLLRARTSS